MESPSPRRKPQVAVAAASVAPAPATRHDAQAAAPSPPPPPPVRWRRLAAAAALAQLLALLTVATTTSSQRLSDLGVVAPAAQLFCAYALLAGVYGPVALLLLWRRRRRRRQQQQQQQQQHDGGGDGAPGPRGVRVRGGGGVGRGGAGERSSSSSSPSSYPWRRYLLLALLDSQANYLVTSAIPVGHASITSATLLSCLSVPASMALSWLVMSRRYTARHAAGAAVCVLGVAVMVAADAGAGGASAPPSSSSSPHRLLGDVLAAAGAVMYACSNVLQERLLVAAAAGGSTEGGGKEGGGAGLATELLASLGAFGSPILALQSLVLERRALSAALSSSSSTFSFATFAGALFVFYSLLPIVLSWGGASLLNVSLLTVGLWAAGARVAFFGGFGSGREVRAFAGALALVSAGIVLYSTAGPPRAEEEGEGGRYNAIATAGHEDEGDDEEAAAAAAGAS
jgi:drug/metabolite transporter (DMT)-like permease